MEDKLENELINAAKNKLEGKTIFAVDFDGTLSFGKYPEVGPANRELIDFLNDRKEKGDKLILWTCRSGKNLSDAVDFCKSEGLEFDAINDNIPEIIDIYGENSRKISCHYYIDDKALVVNAFSQWKEELFGDKINPEEAVVE